MNDKGLRLRDYLGHILQAIERIERYTGDMTEPEFLSGSNAMTQDAVIRNALAHGYFRVDLEIIWKTIQSDLPALHGQLAQLVKGAG